MTRAAHPEAPVGPYFLPWAATDARFFRGAGLPAYGYSPFVIPVTDTLHVGGANERMALSGYRPRRRALPSGDRGPGE